MRTRFLAAAGPSQSLSDYLEARNWPASLPAGWTALLRLADLFIATRTCEPVLRFDNGAVLGSLFRRTDARPVTRADPDLAAEIERTQGRCLIDRHWGAWFAIFTTGEGHWALRDPSAFAPAYYRANGGRSLYFSDLATALELGIDAGGVDLDFLRHWLGFPHLRTRRTGLEGTSELLPGTGRLQAGASERLATAWTPWTFASPDRRIPEFDQAAERLRREALHIIPAQARGRGSLLLELSGGLDSSTIAATLKAGKVPFRSVNFVTRSAEGDERPYARAVAAAMSDAHFEIEEQDEPLDFASPERPRLRPGLSAIMAPLHRQFAAFGEEAGAETFLTGAGGDNVFCYLTTAAPVLDAWRALGPMAAARALRDVSELCSCTAWTTLRFALRKVMRSLRGPAPWRRETDFLLPDAVPLAPERHPWLDAPRGTLPGTREHVAALLRIQHVTDPETRVSPLPFLHPLIAQPLVELCLAIPTWLWVHGGHNRAVARAAFRGLVPEAVLDRRSKGRLEGMCLRSYLRHRLDFDELLLGGLLRQAGLLDADALEAYLEREGAPADLRYFRIFELVTAELWLRARWR